jgi:hypothetical protein
MEKTFLDHASRLYKHPIDFGEDHLRYVNPYSEIDIIPGAAYSRLSIHYVADHCRGFGRFQLPIWGWGIPSVTCRQCLNDDRALKDDVEHARTNDCNIAMLQNLRLLSSCIHR